MSWAPRHLAGQRLADQFHLGGQMRVVAVVPGAHRSAEQHQALIAVQIRAGVRLAAEVDVADAETRLFQCRIEGSEDLERDMLADQDPGHGSGPHRGTIAALQPGPVFQGMK